MIDPLELIDRSEDLFAADVARFEKELRDAVRAGSFLVIGAAGSVGGAVVKEIFRRDPRRLDLVDLNENNLVELVRDLRSSLGYTHGEFNALPLDCGSPEFDAFLAAQPPHDYVLNLSALKHVRSEKDPFTLMRLITVNILNTVKTVRRATERQARKYFAVSTDKAVRPANMMGASKRIMELCLMRAGDQIPISTARFANVILSDGSLPFGFTQRVLKAQPIAAPRDVRRYFITAQESGELCLLSTLLGGNREIFFPKPDERLRLIGFPEIAERYLRSLGFTPHPCGSEDEARGRFAELFAARRWPCYWFDSDTTGEKESEEFFLEGEPLDWERFRSIGIVRHAPVSDPARLERFLEEIAALRASGRWSKSRIVELFREVVDEFEHREKFKYLDGRM